MPPFCSTMCSHARARVRGVHHDHQLVVEPVDRAVVHEGALGREDRRVLHLPPRLERADVVAGDPVDEGVPVGAGDLELAHVGDVEDADAAPHGVVLGEDAGRVLHRHLPAGERHHLGAERLVAVVERGALERRSWRSRGCPPISVAISAFCTCSRFSASSQTRDCGPSITSSRHLLAAVGGEAVEEDRVGSAEAHQGARPRCSPGTPWRGSPAPPPGPSRPRRRC